jgi:lambda family phage portal protein
MFQWLANLLGFGPSRTVSAAYDAAANGDDNKRHWANADSLSALASADPTTRNTICQRSRYETHNNSYAKGIVLTLANDTVGTGPRLQLQLEDRDVNHRTELRFSEWATAVALGEKCRTLKMAKTTDGEGFAHFVTNERLTTPVKLDLMLSECDQFTAPFGVYDARIADGIEFDALGNPVAYHRLREHPGGGFGFASLLESDRLPANQVLHLFRKDRPGQVRGVSEIAPALPLFAQLRRYTLAVINKEENSACITAVTKTTSSNVEAVENDDPFETIDIERGALLTLPDGWDINQFKSEQSATNYKMFKQEVLNEIGRCLNMPLNIAAANSAGYNYSSGRLDHQTYYQSIYVEQSYLEQVLLDRILLAWLKEASLIPGFLPEELKQLARLGQLPPHQWFWDGAEHVDPLKEANAQEVKLRNHTTTLADEWAASGADWETKIRQRAKELALLKELGMVAEAPASPPANAGSQNTQDQQDAQDQQDQQDAQAEAAHAAA